MKKEHEDRLRNAEMLIYFVGKNYPDIAKSVDVEVRQIAFYLAVDKIHTYGTFIFVYGIMYYLCAIEYYSLMEEYERCELMMRAIDLESGYMKLRYPRSLNDPEIGTWNKLTPGDIMNMSLLLSEEPLIFPNSK